MSSQGEGITLQLRALRFPISSGSAISLSLHCAVLSASTPAASGNFAALGSISSGFQKFRCQSNLCFERRGVPRVHSEKATSPPRRVGFAEGFYRGACLDIPSSCRPVMSQLSPFKGLNINIPIIIPIR